ncbi:hypothetical protein ULG90_06315 [Halopseudomonas pachastrellae]|nr:hypothetical protein ULG90_06315 [Halopseudomonas pachastrellae]
MARGVAPSSSAAFAAIEHDDILAAGFARLLLWTARARCRALERCRPRGTTTSATGARVAAPKTWAPLYAQAMEEVRRAE